MQSAEKVVLITGAARRIGRAMALHLHMAGFRIIVHCCSSITAADELVAYCNQQRALSAFKVVADLSNPTYLEAMVTEALSLAGRLDGVINNASCFVRDEKVSWDTMFRINVQAPYQLSHLVYDELCKTRGAIINITDTHIDHPLKHYDIYCQSKAALWMQTQSLARKFAPKIRVNAIAPGAIMWPEADNLLNTAIEQQIVAATLLKRHGDPQFIAQTAFFLLDSPFITGQMLRVDGGRWL